MLGILDNIERIDRKLQRWLPTESTPSVTPDLRPPLLDWQKRVVSEARRFNVVCVGRRAGKTMLGIALSADPVVLPYPVGWFSPSYKLMLEVWREVVRLFSPIIARQNATDRRIEFTTGGLLEFWSLDNPQAGRGRKYKRVVVDEAAFVPDLMDIWNYAIRPTLADLAGDAWILSTPKGRNGFWRMWQMGQDVGQDDWRSWQMPSDVNPLIPPGELDEMRRSLPEMVVRQELDAEFLDDAGGVFRRVMDAATATPLDRPLPGHAYIAGVDVADAADFTVISIVDAADRKQVYLDRFNRVGYEALGDRLHAAYQRFGVQTMVIEDNSIGQPVIDRLQNRGMNIVPFHTSAVTKMPLIQALQSAFEHDELRIIPDPVQVAELQAYESKRTGAGFSYSAPSGMHDDTVMALALAWYGVAGFRPAFL